MLESVLYLVVGILIFFIMVSLSGKKVDVIGNVAISASVFFALYVAVACALILLNAFSVNRSIMAVDGLGIVTTASIWLFRGRPKPDICWKPGENFALLVFLVVLAVVGKGLVNDGFYGMDCAFGVSQAKTMNLISSNEESPFLADYLEQPGVEAYDRINELNADLASRYDGFVVPVVAVLSFGGYFFGLSSMSCGFLVAAGAIVTLVWMLVRVKRRKMFVMAATVTVSIILVFLTLGTGNGRTVRVTWDELEQLDDIVSEYDIVLMGRELMDDYYVPVACVTGAKVYPMYSNVGDVMEQVKLGGERVYYLTRAYISGALSDELSVDLKNVYSNGNVKMYRMLNFYRTHTSVDNSRFIRAALLVLLSVVGCICYMALYSCLFTRFDAACNLLLSLATVTGLYAVVGGFLQTVGSFDIAYCIAVVMMLGLVGFSMLVAIGRKPYYLYDVRKTAGLVPALFVCSIILMKNLEGDLYQQYTTIGSTQLWALKYICNSGLTLDGIASTPWLTALMAAIGSIFSYKYMIWVLPVMMDAAVIAVFVLFERLVSRIVREDLKKALYGVINVAAVILLIVSTVMLLGRFQDRSTTINWETLEAYANVVEPDDAIAIQTSAYSAYALPVQMMTGVHKLCMASDYDDAVQLLDNYGKDAYYITSEIMDPTYNRLNIVAHINSEYMYRTYAYLTERGIYSVSDSVVQGFHTDKDTSGMAWTSDQNAFIQVDIPYGKYDTVRLYLGDTVKLDEINLEYIELEFRENWHYVSTSRIDSDNNGTYIDFKLNNSYLVDGYNVIYFHSSVMWSPLIYGDKDIRVMGFPFLYLQFMNTEDEVEVSEIAE